MLSLMFLLTVGATCFCDSYDADPYDDVPPVTVEFSFVGTQAVSIQGVQFKTTRNSTWPVNKHAVNHFKNLRMFAACASLAKATHPDTPLFSPLRT